MNFSTGNPWGWADNSEGAVNIAPSVRPQGFSQPSGLSIGNPNFDIGPGGAASGPVSAPQALPVNPVSSPFSFGAPGSSNPYGGLLTRFGGMPGLGGMNMPQHHIGGAMGLMGPNMWTNTLNPTLFKVVE